MDKQKSYKIGKYTVYRVLSKNNLKSVFLASDTGQDRKVVIKILKEKSESQNSPPDLSIKDAKSLSELKHPNIISFYEIGEQKGIPYLVSEYFEGEILSDLIKRKKSLPVRDAVKIMSQILDGMAHAHQQGIVHNDLRPENILISSDGVPGIKDFGISMMACHGTGRNCTEKEITQYTAPECFLKGVMNKSSNVYSLGMILYEMLTSKPSITADKAPDMLYKISFVPTVHPSLENPEVDPLLDSIVEKATQKDPKARFQNAAVLKKVIDYYLESPGNEKPAEPEKSESQGILSLLLGRMKNNSDFPAFSKSIMAINEKTSTDQYVSVRDLAEIIMRDYSLTNKMLTLVNSSFYGGIGNGVTNIEQAVIILGLEQVRLMAGAMMVFTQIQNKSNIEELKDSMIKSYMSGLIAIEVAKHVKSKETEVAFLCAMFQTLGKNLTIYYMPEEYSGIKNLIREKSIEMNNAAYEIMGVSFDEIGVCIARHWKFPEAIIYGMRSLPEGTVEKPQSTLEMIRHFSIFANEICEVASLPFDEQSVNQLIQLINRFELSISISKKDVLDILFDSIEKIKQHASVLEINPAKSQFITNLLNFAEAGKNSVFFKDMVNFSPANSSQVQADHKSVNNKITDSQPDSFHNKILPLWNKIVRKK